MKSQTIVSIVAIVFFLRGTILGQCTNEFPPTGNVKIHTTNNDKSLDIGGNVNCSDVAIQLRYELEVPYFGIFALTTPGNYNLYSPLTPERTPGDIVFSAIGSAPSQTQG